MIRLKNVTLNMYKTIETKQSFDVEPDVTVLVGQNESGKTAILEAITTSNPLWEDRYEYDMDRDYPRRLQHLSEDQASKVTVFEATFVLSDEFMSQIRKITGDKSFSHQELSITRNYGSDELELQGIDIDDSGILNLMFSGTEIEDDEEYRAEILEAVNTSDYDAMITRLIDDGLGDLAENIRSVYDDYANLEQGMRNYLRTQWIEPKLPKYLYYDEYYQLPSEINVYELHHNRPETPDAKTSQSLLELAELDTDLILGDDDEKIERSLEDASRRLTDTLRKYWTREDAPRIVLRITKASIQRGQPAIVVRVENSENEGSLPLESRSKGFRYFFSFMVWFSKIQEDEGVEYILLLDEPGLSLHGSAQANLLRFFDDLARNYQIIYTTHSPFMIDPARLYRVRTVSKKRALKGTEISDNLYDGDREALLALQAALGVNITQSLFIGASNVVVEGISDVLYINTMSSILRNAGRTGLSQGIILVPIAGADKAASFIALFSGNDLDVACLLDTFVDSAGKQRVDDMIKRGIIREKNVRYYDEFNESQSGQANIEDMFEKCEYLQLYNAAFDERKDINENDLDEKLPRITQQIHRILKKHYNHTRPAKHFARAGNDEGFLSEQTLDSFEKMFQEINKLFETEN